MLLCRFLSILPEDTTDFKSIKWSASGIGTTAGKAVVTFKNFSGSLTIPFEVKAGNLNDTNTIKVVTPSVQTKDVKKTSQIYIEQSGYTVENGAQTASNDGQLLSSLKNSNFAPGKTYKEEIAAANNGTADEYV